MKQQLNVRIPNLTRRQLDEIAELEAMTAGEVVALAVERLWQSIQQPQRPQPALTFDVYLAKIGYEINVCIGGKYAGFECRDFGEDRDIDESKQDFLIRFKGMLEGFRAGRPACPSCGWVRKEERDDNV